MTNRNIWIGIVIGAFFVGIIGTYAVSAISYNSPMMTNNQFMQHMMNDPQLMQQMHDIMINDPQHMNQMMIPMMNTMMGNPKMQQQMMNTMMDNPEMMQSMMGNQNMMRIMSGMNP